MRLIRKVSSDHLQPTKPTAAVPTVAMPFGSHKSDRRRARRNEHLACAGRSDGIGSLGCTHSIIPGPVVHWYHPQAMWQQQRGRVGAARTEMKRHKLVSVVHNSGPTRPLRVAAPRGTQCAPPRWAGELPPPERRTGGRLESPARRCSFWTGSLKVARDAVSDISRTVRCVTDAQWNTDGGWHIHIAQGPVAR